MSRMLMALGVVAALGILPTEASAAPLSPVLPPAVGSEVIVPGVACFDLAHGAADVVYTYGENSIRPGAAPTTIFCPLPRPSSSGVTFTVTIGGKFVADECYAVSGNQDTVSYALLPHGLPKSFPVAADSTLSVQCDQFGLGLSDIISYIKVKG